MALESFRKLGLSESALAALAQKGFEEPTQIQEKVIPLLLKNEVDIVGQAQTGTGKTAAFGLPLLDMLTEGAGHVQVLVLTPTRELALQVSEEINSLRGKKRLHIAAVYGGQSIEQQIQRLRRGVDIVVGTPGRIIDHIGRRTLDLSGISFFILDEADEMLDMGFIEDIEEILRAAPGQKRVLLFSATMPRPILTLAERYMGKYQLIRATPDKLTVDLTEQIYFEVNESDKLEALCRIVDMEHAFYGLVFCRTKIDVDVLGRKLADRGYDAEALHGDISQYQRERILERFKKRRVNILVATDVAARGLDISDLSHVINYSLPQDPESYVHRIGRTGRAGKQGTAVTFVTPEEYRRLVVIKKVARTEITRKKLPDISEVIEHKRQRIKEAIASALDTGGLEPYQDMATTLLGLADSSSVVAAMVKHSFAEELDPRSYREISDASVDTRGRARLFVGKGSLDGMTPAKLVSFIKEETGIDERIIRDVLILEKFSFLSVPFEEAEVILEAFRRLSGGRRPLVDRAKERAPGQRPPARSHRPPARHGGYRR